MSETTTEKKSKVSEDLSLEIDDGIEETMADIVADREDKIDSGKEDKSGAKADEDIPSEKDQSDDETEGVEPPEDGDEASDDDDDDEDAITDELLTRAVKTGLLTIAEAKGFQSGALLESMCEKLEKKVEAEESEGADSGKDKPDPLADIPDIELDPEIDYDPAVIGLVDSIKALKELVTKQSSKIDDLETAGTEGAAKTFFEKSVSGLEKDYAKALKGDQKRHDALRKQYDVLAAGYKATGDKISQDEVFKQAVAVAMGDVKITVKEKQLKKRTDQFIKPPGGSKTEGASEDPLNEIADAVDKKYFGKK